MSDWIEPPHEEPTQEDFERAAKPTPGQVARRYAERIAQDMLAFIKSVEKALFPTSAQTAELDGRVVKALADKACVHVQAAIDEERGGAEGFEEWLESNLVPGSNPSHSRIKDLRAAYTAGQRAREPKP